MLSTSAEGVCLKHTSTFVYMKDKRLINNKKKMTKVSQFQLSYR